jgi:CubicO group peptidase (beta-lactamase class C family)
MKRLWALVVLLSLALLSLSAQDKEKPVVPPKDTADLEQQIRKILTDKKVPGTGVVIADRNGIVWLAGFGKSDIAANKDVTPDTLFRIGSISKTFVALAALKLESEGRLDLNATVRSLAPDVKFENPWESTDPVRVIHLLEHTTGWDDLRLKEYASSDPKPLTLQEGLEIAPVSRTSRWKPGTRYSYCNSGPAVTAYIIEKITGQRFEDYIAQNFFQPIGMPTADYFYSQQTQQLLTKLYHSDGKTPYPYWHISLRPAGSINASAREMGNYIRFFLNRGAVNGVQLIPAESIISMEVPTTYYGARAGLKTGYAKHNYTTLDDNGFVWHGHNGGVEGGLSEMAYLPDQGIGYFFSINAGNGNAFDKISKLLQAYVTKDFPKPELPPPAHIPTDIAQQYSGWYQAFSPRNQTQYFLERLLGLAHVTFSGDQLTVNPILGSRRNYVAVSDHLYRREKQSMATLALMPSEDGLLLQTASTTAVRVSAGLVWTEIVLTILILLAIVTVILFALIWLPRLLMGGLRGVKHLSTRVLPLLATLCLAGCVGIFIFSGDDLLERFGNATPYSIGFMLLTIGFAVFSLAGFFVALRADRREMNRVAYWHSFVSSLLLSVATIYLMYWGMIGFRSWA